MCRVRLGNGIREENKTGGFTQIGIRFPFVSAKIPISRPAGFSHNQNVYFPFLRMYVFPGLECKIPGTFGIFFAAGPFLSSKS